PSSATRWFDATHAAAWYRMRSAASTRNGRMPSVSAIFSTRGDPSTAHHAPASRLCPTSADGSDWSGCREPTSTSGRASSTPSSSCSVDAPERWRSEEHTSELQSPYDLVCRLLLEKKNTKK